MFRRRRMMQANPLNNEQMAQLVKANQLVAQGKPLQAAALFVQVAQAMQASNHPRRAANLYTRAAHAFVDGNEGPSALNYSRQALALFIQVNMPMRARTFYSNITHKMGNRGMNGALETLQSEFEAQMTALPAGPAPAAPTRHGMLPTNCPKCGAPVHTEDANWVDENTLECEYCGAFIRSE